MDDIQQALHRYVTQRCPVGGFLQAVLENNLKETYQRADSVNKDRVPEILRFCYNNIPATCWGSKEKVDDWLKG